MNYIQAKRSPFNNESKSTDRIDNFLVSRIYLEQKVKNMLTEKIYNENSLEKCLQSKEISRLKKQKIW